MRAGPGLRTGPVYLTRAHLQQLHALDGGGRTAGLAQLAELGVDVLVALLCLLQQPVQQLLPAHAQCVILLITYFYCHGHCIIISYVGRARQQTQEDRPDQPHSGSQAVPDSQTRGRQDQVSAHPGHERPAGDPKQNSRKGPGEPSQITE